MCIYIYIYRERETKREKEIADLLLGESALLLGQEVETPLQYLYYRICHHLCFCLLLCIGFYSFIFEKVLLLCMYVYIYIYIYNIYIYIYIYAHSIYMNIL